MTRTAFSASTIDLDDLAARVHQLAGQCAARALSLHGAAELTPPEWHHRARSIATQVDQITSDLQRVASGLTSTSQAYSQREAFLSAAAHEASSTLFWGMGRLLALFAPAAIPAVLGGVVAVMTASALTGKRPEELISSPAFVTGLEYVVSGIDDFAAGMLGIPLPLIAALGERGLGVSDPSAVAGVIVLGAGALGGISGISGISGVGGMGAGQKVLVETPVTVTRVSTGPGQSPRGIEDLLGRIPRADPEMPQVRIEKYEGAPDENVTFIVYLGGTIDAALMATNEPWDMTSNVNALADMDAGSYRAAVEAMHAAGITSDDLVTLVGHSQGGLLAARIAESEEFRVGDVVTVGAPIHQVPIPEGVTLTAIEHNEDLVPALGGIAVGGIAVGGVGAAALATTGTTATPPTATGTTTTVRRSALTGITPSASDPLPGHNLSRYIETGRVMDQSADAQLRALRARIATNTQGTVEVTMWRGERVTR